MSNPNGEKLADNVAATGDLPNSSKKQPYGESDQLKFPGGPSPPMGYGAIDPVPNQYQPYHGLPGTGYNQDPVLQPPQVVIVRPAQPTNEPDYLAYSIFTMLCCCLPLGVAALLYSIQTRDANNMGNGTAARHNSRIARNLAHAALGIGLVLLIAYVTVMVIILNQAHHKPPNNL